MTDLDPTDRVACDLPDEPEQLCPLCEQDRDLSDKYADLQRRYNVMEKAFLAENRELELLRQELANAKRIMEEVVVSIGDVVGGLRL